MTTDADASARRGSRDRRRRGCCSRRRTCRRVSRPAPSGGTRARRRRTCTDLARRRTSRTTRSRPSPSRTSPTDRSGSAILPRSTAPLRQVDDLDLLARACSSSRVAPAERRGYGAVLMLHVGHDVGEVAVREHLRVGAVRRSRYGTGCRRRSVSSALAIGSTRTSDEVTSLSHQSLEISAMVAPLRLRGDDVARQRQLGRRRSAPPWFV